MASLDLVEYLTGRVAHKNFVAGEHFIRVYNHFHENGLTWDDVDVQQSYQLNDWYVVFPGSFNPLHAGHYMVYKAITEHAYTPLLEISVGNADKGEIDVQEIARRVEAVYTDWSEKRLPDIIIGAAALFKDKRRVYGIDRFAVGIDTLKRVLDPKYGDVHQTVDGTTFFVAPRRIGESDGTLETIEGIEQYDTTTFVQLTVPEAFWSMSSTAVREGKEPAWPTIL